MTDDSRETRAAIEKLRAFVRDPCNHELANWLAMTLAGYLEHASNGLTLDEALGIKPQRGSDPWWVQEDRFTRDAAIRELARKFSIESVSEQARQVINQTNRYRHGRWRFDKERERVEYQDPENRALYDVMKGNSGQLPSESMVRRALVDHEMSDFMQKVPCSNGSRSVGDDDEHSSE